MSRPYKNHDLLESTGLGFFGAGGSGAGGEKPAALFTDVTVVRGFDDQCPIVLAEFGQILDGQFQDIGLAAG